MNTSFQNRRVLLQRSLTMATAMATQSSAWAQALTPLPAAVPAAVPTAVPTQLRLLCTGPAGSIPDTIARRYAEALADRYPAGVVVDNRAGAAGQIAIAALKLAASDGTTLLLAQGAVATVYPSFYKQLAYDPVTDLKPVSLAAEATLALAVGPSVPDSVTTLSGLIAWLKRNPQQANYGSPGNGTLPHLVGAAFFLQAQTDAQHVVYNGGPAAMVDLMGGRLAALVLPEGMLRQHASTGRLRVLATSGNGRSAYMPGVASFAEQGFSGLVVREWFAFFAPGATSTGTVEVASSAIRLSAANAAVSSALADAGMQAVASTPSALVQRIASEQREWQAVLRATGVRAE